MASVFTEQDNRIPIISRRRRRFKVKQAKHKNTLLIRGLYVSVFISGIVVFFTDKSLLSSMNSVQLVTQNSPYTDTANITFAFSYFTDIKVGFKVMLSKCLAFAGPAGF